MPPAAVKMAGAAALGSTALGSAMSEAVLWAGVLLAAILIGGAAVVIIKRVATGPAAPDGRGSLLEHLEELRRRGELSEEEYRRARDSALAAAGRKPPSKGHAPADASGGPRQSDAGEST